MNKKWLILTIALNFTLSILNVSAQKKLSLSQYEDSINKYFIQLLTHKTDSSKRVVKNQVIKVVNKVSILDDSTKTSINNNIITLFTEALKIKNSFYYPFLKLKNVSKLTAPDSLVRIISWNVPVKNGEYVYFAFIQQLDKKSKKIKKLFKLFDASSEIKNPEKEKLDAQNWYGALYYKIKTNTHKKRTYYTLLGWDGNNNFTNKKLIECFYIDKGELIIGPPIFKMGDEIKNRIIFEYAKQAKMMLRFDKKINMIVYDHLAPSHKKFTGQFMHYGPDMSQDGIQFIDGYWLLKPNLDLRNMEESKGKSIKKSF